MVHALVTHFDQPDAIRSIADHVCSVGENLTLYLMQQANNIDKLDLACSDVSNVRATATGSSTAQHELVA